MALAELSELPKNAVYMIGEIEKIGKRTLTGGEEKSIKKEREGGGQIHQTRCSLIHICAYVHIYLSYIYIYHIYVY